MRFVIFGVGAIGGVVAGKLHASGAEVAGIARGRQLDALRDRGLLLRTPQGDVTATFAVAGTPGELGLRPDDIILLCMKSQDTLGALQALREAGAHAQPIVCMQNGVANEPASLRYFPNVYGVMVALPGVYTMPGTVAGFGIPRAGIFDVGRYPSGRDAIVDRLCAALDDAGFAAFPTGRVMDHKYLKLISNLGNVIDAAGGVPARSSPLGARVRDEGRAVLEAAGIAIADSAADEARRGPLLRDGDIPGVERIGSSSAQSLARGAGSIETDYLNGEIVLLARLHGMSAPLNERLVALGRMLIAQRRPAGSMSVDDIARFVEAQ